MDDGTSLMTGDDAARPGGQEPCLGALAAALERRGLTARVGAGALVAGNPAVSHTEDPRGRTMNPGLFQHVVLAGTEDGTPYWHWCWAGPQRDSPLEMEPMCPAEEVEHAADLIAKVLRLDAGTED